jgi:hypothetical protein
MFSNLKWILKHIAARFNSTAIVLYTKYPVQGKEGTIIGDEYYSSSTGRIFVSKTSEQKSGLEKKKDLQ